MHRRPAHLAAFATIAVGLTLLLILLSIAVGSKPIPLRVVADALLKFDPLDSNHEVIRDLRLPRAIVCGFAGMALAVSGALMQGISRNPIAGPSLLGLGGGAMCAQVIALSFVPTMGIGVRISMALFGAVLGGGAVFSLASVSRGPVSSAKLALIGINVSMLLAAIANGLIALQDLPHEMLSWFSRGTQVIGWYELVIALPLFTAGFALAMVLSASVNALSLGEESAIGIGARTHRVRLVGAACTILLAGTAYALLGPVAFIGLLVPHAARAIVGLDYRRVIPTAAVLGVVTLVAADLAARSLEDYLSYPVPVSVLTALIGSPFFIILLGRRGVWQIAGTA